MSLLWVFKELTLSALQRNLQAVINAAGNSDGNQQPL
jgi:hypothetical protein